MRLRGDVVGVRGGRGPGGVQVDALGALQQLGHRQAGGGLGVGRVGVDQLLVLRDRAVDVAVAERVLGGGVARVEVGLAVLVHVDRTADRGWCRPVDAVHGQLLHHLGERGPQLVDREHVLEQRRRPAVDDRHDQRDRRDLHRLRDRRHRVDVDEADEEPALELAGQRRQVVGQRRRSRASGSASRTTSSTGAVIDDSMVLWKFSSVISTAYDDPPTGRTAGGAAGLRTGRRGAGDRRGRWRRDGRTAAASWRQS